MNFQAEKFEHGKVRARYPRGASARIIHESGLAHEMQQCSVAHPVVASETLALKHNHVGLEVAVSLLRPTFDLGWAVKQSPTTSQGPR